MRFLPFSSKMAHGWPVSLLLLMTAPRRFQFSLRKMLLWTAVWAVYLGIGKVIGVWQHEALVATVFFGVLLGIRLIWGYDSGSWIAVLLTGCGLACCSIGSSIASFGFPDSPLLLLGTGWLFFCCGLLFGIVGFVCVHWVVIAVDWIDNLIGRKTSEEPPP